MKMILTTTRSARLLALTFLLALLATLGPRDALAATTANSIITAQTPNRGIVQFLQGTDSSGNYKTLYTAGANGSMCFGMWSTNNDASVTHLITVQIVNAAVKYGGMSITSVVNSGFVNGTPAQSLTSPANWTGLPVDSNGNPFIPLNSGDTLQATFATALTATDVINIVVSCVDY
jgi:hypothetical protein